eukprot:349620-Chlamydomonas_euryale.AAC.5
MGAWSQVSSREPGYRCHHGSLVTGVCFFAGGRPIGRTQHVPGGRPAIGVAEPPPGAGSWWRPWRSVLRDATPLVVASVLFLWRGSLEFALVMQPKSATNKMSRGHNEDATQISHE